MNIERLPVQPKPQAKTEKIPKQAGTSLAQEMLVNMVLGGDSRDTSRLLAQTVAQSVKERLKFLGADLDKLKEPPFSLDASDPKSPGWEKLSQKILESLVVKPEWQKLLAKAKKEALETQKPIGEEYGFEVYQMIAETSTEVIRKQAERQQQKRPRSAA